MHMHTHTDTHSLSLSYTYANTIHMLLEHIQEVDAQASTALRTEHLVLLLSVEAVAGAPLPAVVMPYDIRGLGV